jgi:hypothetical protein
MKKKMKITNPFFILLLQKTIAIYRMQHHRRDCIVLTISSSSPFSHLITTWYQFLGLLRIAVDDVLPSSSHEIIPLDDRCDDWCKLETANLAIDKKNDSILSVRGKKIRLDLICPELIMEKVTPNIPKSDLILLETIGQGAYGRVTKAKLCVRSTQLDKDENENEEQTKEEEKWVDVAVKLCTAPPESGVLVKSQSHIMSLRYEIHLLSLMQHPNIITLKGVCFDDAVPWIIMDLAIGGELCVQLTDPFQFISTMSNFFQIFDIEYLNSNLSLDMKLTEIPALRDAMEALTSVTSHMSRFSRISVMTQQLLQIAQFHWKTRKISSHERLMEARDDVS